MSEVAVISEDDGLIDLAMDSTTDDEDNFADCSCVSSNSLYKYTGYEEAVFTDEDNVEVADCNLSEDNVEGADDNLSEDSVEVADDNYFYDEVF